MCIRDRYKQGELAGVKASFFGIAITLYIASDYFGRNYISGHLIQPLIDEHAANSISCLILDCVYAEKTEACKANL